MIIKKRWTGRKTTRNLFNFVHPKYEYEGYFLFGIIPLWITRNLY